MKKPKQTPLQRDVEYVLDAQFIDEIWGRRFLRRLVREAAENAITAWETGDGDDKEIADRIARELIPSKERGRK